MKGSRPSVELSLLERRSYRSYKSTVLLSTSETEHKDISGKRQEGISVEVRLDGVIGAIFHIL